MVGLMVWGLEDELVYGFRGSKFAVYALGLCMCLPAILRKLRFGTLERTGCIELSEF